MKKPTVSTLMCTVLLAVLSMATPYANATDDSEKTKSTAMIQVPTDTNLEKAKKPMFVPKEIFLYGTADGKKLRMVLGFAKNWKFVEAVGDFLHDGYQDSELHSITFRNFYDPDKHGGYNGVLRRTSEFLASGNMGLKDLLLLPNYWESLKKIGKAYSVSMEKWEQETDGIDKRLRAQKLSSTGLVIASKTMYYVVIEGPIKSVLKFIGTGGTYGVVLAGHTLKTAFFTTVTGLSTVLVAGLSGVLVTGSTAYSAVSAGIPSLVSLLATGVILTVEGGKWVAWDKPKELVRYGIRDKQNFPNVTPEQYEKIKTRMIELTGSYQELGMVARISGTKNTTTISLERNSKEAFRFELKYNPRKEKLTIRSLVRRSYIKAYSELGADTPKKMAKRILKEKLETTLNIAVTTCERMLKGA